MTRVLHAVFDCARAIITTPLAVLFNEGNGYSLDQRVLSRNGLRLAGCRPRRPCRRLPGVRHAAEDGVAADGPPG